MVARLECFTRSVAGMASAFSLRVESHLLRYLNFENPSELERPFQHLAKTESPPTGMWVLGKKSALELLLDLPERGLAIVGTRNPTGRSTEFLKKEIYSLTGERLIILSGLARGVDSVAHRAALEARLPTIAVLGCGVNHPYPRENQDLKSEIVQSGGLVVSEYPPDLPPQKSYFLDRNRLIAGWSKATWIVEASFGSGALNTAKWARKMDRTCYATPCFPGDISFAGNQLLMQELQATPLWNTSNLGQSWLELAAKKRPRRKRTQGHSRDSGLAPPDEKVLGAWVAESSRSGSGAIVHHLLGRAIEEAGWSPQRFFVALRKALEIGAVTDDRGVLRTPL